jgi:hypothetical protein
VAKENEPKKKTSIEDQIIERCKYKKFNFIKWENPYNGNEILRSIDLPNGRDVYRCPAGGVWRLKEMLESHFEDYVVLGNFMAVANYKEDSIEAIVSAESGFGDRWLHQIIGEDQMELRVTADRQTNTISIELSQASNLISAIFFNRRENLFSFKINGCNVNTHDKCTNVLKKLSDSFLLQVFLKTGILVTLATRPIKESVAERFNKSEVTPDFWRFPTNQFDEAPAALFWNAQMQKGAALLQFLGFYQVLEFYFIRCSEKTKIKHVRNAINDPAFISNKDASIIEVISIARDSRFETERGQLLETITECINERDLVEFIDCSSQRKDVYGKRQGDIFGGNQDTQGKYILKSNSKDLLRVVSDVVYGIRCAIVHTKNGEHHLHPYSKGVDDLLPHYVELIEFLAKKTLVAMSAPLEI